MNNTTITFVGHVGKAPTSTSFENGNTVAHFPIAVKEYSSNSDEETTMWLDVESWNGLAERVVDIVTKGRQVYIRGQLTLNTYTKDVKGESVKMTKPVIKLSYFEVLGPKPASGEETEPQPNAGSRRKPAVA